MRVAVRVAVRMARKMRIVWVVEFGFGVGMPKVVRSRARNVLRRAVCVSGWG